MVGNEEKIQMTNYGIFTLSQSRLAWCLVPFIVWRVPNNVSLSVSLTDWLMIWLTFHIEVFRHNCCLLQTLPLFGENVPILQIGYLLVTLKVPTFTCLLEMWKRSLHSSSAFRSIITYNCPVSWYVLKILVVWCDQCYAWWTLSKVSMAWEWIWEVRRLVLAGCL